MSPKELQAITDFLKGNLAKFFVYTKQLNVSKSTKTYIIIRTNSTYAPMLYRFFCNYAIDRQDRFHSVHEIILGKNLNRLFAIISDQQESEKFTRCLQESIGLSHSLDFRFSVTNRLLLSPKAAQAKRLAENLMTLFPPHIIPVTISYTDMGKVIIKCKDDFYDTFRDLHHELRNIIAFHNTPPCLIINGPSAAIENQVKSLLKVPWQKRRLTKAIALSTYDFYQCQIEDMLALCEEIPPAQSTHDTLTKLNTTLNQSYADGDHTFYSEAHTFKCRLEKLSIKVRKQFISTVNKNLASLAITVDQLDADAMITLSLPPKWLSHLNDALGFTCYDIIAHHETKLTIKFAGYQDQLLTLLTDDLAEQLEADRYEDFSESESREENEDLECCLAVGLENNVQAPIDINIPDRPETPRPN